MKNKSDIINSSILLIGGMNLDILGTAEAVFVPGDSLPGNIQLTPGGVAYNIALRLAEAKINVQLLTVIGNDLLSQTLVQSCENSGIGLNHSVYAQTATPIYLAVHNLEGDMVCAINQMDALALLTPSLLRQKLIELNEPFDLCVLDANLSEDCLRTAAEHLQIPLVADPVSAVKCHRLSPIMHRLFAIKPNLMEAEAMTGHRDPAKAAQCLLEKGVQQVYISMGGQGIFYADQHKSGTLPAPVLPPVSLTGAGDAMTAGITRGIQSGLDVSQIATLGIESSFNYLLYKYEKQRKGVK